VEFNQGKFQICMRYLSNRSVDCGFLLQKYQLQAISQSVHFDCGFSPQKVPDTTIAKVRILTVDFNVKVLNLHAIKSKSFDRGILLLKSFQLGTITAKCAF
jgi:hypothetical protein